MSLKDRFNKTKYRHKKYIKNIYLTGKGKDFRIRFVSKEIFDESEHIYFDYFLHSLQNRHGYTKFYKCLTKKGNCPACEDAYETIEAEKVSNAPKREAWRKVKRKYAVYYGFVYQNGERELSLIHVPAFTYNNEKDVPTLNDNLQSKIVGIEKVNDIDVFDPKEGRDVLIRIKGEESSIVTKIDFDIDSRKPLTSKELEELKKANSLDKVYEPLTRLQLLSVIQKVPLNEVKDKQQLKKEAKKENIESEEIIIPEEKEVPVSEKKEGSSKEEKLETEEIKVEDSEDIDLSSFYDNNLNDKFSKIMDDE